ncbi:DinB family protein [Streptomyces sp. SBT349]|uniref:DinB family protein n=1 Tax=Streptomyces sp. SBT349 TaxID=1580539 RepID=UPI000A43BBE6|nr:DinB family protein [Streptomyces sp. SBT349]
MDHRKTRGDMFLAAEEDPRGHGPVRGDERATIMEFPRRQRLTLELKCAGLSPADLARRSVEPSTMSLLGLVRHLAEVERRWFQVRMAGLDTPPHYYGDEDRDGDFDGAVGDPAVVADAWRVWREDCAFTDRFVAEAGDLGTLSADPESEPVSLREVLVHLVEEYARHNGHADLLRERVDGRIGL